MKYENIDAVDESVAQFKENHKDSAKVIDMKKSTIKNKGKSILKAVTSLDIYVQQINSNKVIGCAICLIIGAVLFGTLYFGSSDTAPKEKITTTKQAVQGDHLVDFPRDYEKLAEEEAARKAELEKEAEKRKFDEMFDTRKKVVETEPVPEKSQLVYERGRYQHDPEYEMRLKALESPIGFEIGK